MTRALLGALAQDPSTPFHRDESAVLIVLLRTTTFTIRPRNDFVLKGVGLFFINSLDQLWPGATRAARALRSSREGERSIVSFWVRDFHTDRNVDFFSVLHVWRNFGSASQAEELDEFVVRGRLNAAISMCAAIDHRRRADPRLFYIRLDEGSLLHS
ncbi:hypothetical protein HGRIS_011854 [Hohenbuehelia grisea]|uniref:Uncharacterized protein n=1 Tax=Hohenbuehelia grisea TaxID=104357 RepID=A0ABR3JYF0_9AGAR